MDILTQISSKISHAWHDYQSSKALAVIKQTSLLLLLNLLPCPALAFYEWEEGEHKLEATGLIRGFGMGLQNPDNQFFYQKRNIVSAGDFARLMLSAKWDEQLSLEVHAEQSYIPQSLQTGGSRFSRNSGVERSNALAWSTDKQQAQLQFDRFNLQYKNNNLTLKLGRQPLNLAASFFFTPNDFFSPFAAQTFYRTYKSGVDGARLDVPLGEFSQLSLISVLGYSLDNHSDSGWSNQPNLDKTSYLARISTVIADFEWAILGGRVRKNDLIGMDFQGEVFEWVGIRGEGHYNFSQPAQVKNNLEFALSLEHRWENSFTLRLEQFYHGAGANSVDNYANQLFSATNTLSPYLAKLYTALGVSYEITPLLTGNATFLYNGVDSSSLLALYANYSLSDESELALSINVPLGDKPAGYRLKDEFGLYPRVMSLEYRCYF